MITAQNLYDTTFTTTHVIPGFDTTGGDVLVMSGTSHAGVTFTPSDNFGNQWITNRGAD